MKLTVFLMTVAILQVNANGFSQTITYSGREVPLVKIFSVIKEQAGFGFIYFDEQLKGAKKVTLNVKNATVEEVLTISMKNQPYDYSIKAKTIFIIDKQKKETISTTTNEKGDKRINISGKVTGEQGEPVIGATVTIKGTEVATSTNDRGEFFLNDVKEDAVLVVTNVSYQSTEVALRGRSSLDVKLRVSAGDLDEAVVVAYNTTTQRRNTGAVTIVKGEQIQSLPSRSFDRSLQGMVPGLLVTPGNGQPGGGLSNFVLRGIATATEPSGNTSTESVRNPLIIIDGIPVTQDFVQLKIGPNHGNPLAQLNPSDIESISVLKDASAVALYGSRASNGVILVTTKKGKSGKTTFSFRHQTDISSRLKGKVEMLDQQEYFEMLFAAYKNTPKTVGGVQIPWTDATTKSDLIDKFPTIVNAPGDTAFYPAADWLNEMFVDNATTVSNEISMSGGSERNSFYINLEYTKQNGILKNTGYDRKSLRFNFENRPTDWLKIGLNNAISYNIQDYRSSDYFLATLMSPLNPVRLNSGDYMYNYTWGTLSSSLQPNPIAVADNNIYNNTAFRGMSKMYGEIGFLKNFKISSTVGIDFMLAEAKEKNDPRLAEGGFAVNTGRIEERDIRRANLITTNILRYDRAFNKNHALGILIGQEGQILSQKDLYLQVTGLKLPYYDQLNSVGVTVQQNQSSGVRKKETLLSMFSQANYSFKNRYFLSASIRRDGSSRFGDDRRYGTYWSGGGGWVLTSEPFMEPALPWINYFKIRGSLGAAGNAGAISALTRFDRLQSSTFMGSTAVFSISASPSNPDVQWEQTFTWDVGFEVKLLKERISITTDIYERNTSNLIYQVNLPQSTGYSSFLSNIGEMENKGVELSVSLDIIKNKNLLWNLRGNWATNRNKLIKANTPLPLIDNVLANQEGENFNSFYLVRWAGVDPVDGAPQWLDSTGELTKTYDPNNRVFVGKPQPDGFGTIINTIGYKNFELSAMLYYQYGFQLYDAEMTYLLNDGVYPYINQVKGALNYWQKAGDEAPNPRRSLNNTKDGGNKASTRYLFDGDFIRLQNVSISYNCPKGLTSRLRLSNCKLFIQGNNLKVWTKYPSGDPGIVNIGGRSAAGSSYPLQQSFSIGLNANF